MRLQAVAKVRKIAPHLYVEEVLAAALGPSTAMQEMVELAGSIQRHASEILASSVETRDHIHIISDYIVDLYRSKDESAS